MLDSSRISMRSPVSSRPTNIMPWASSLGTRSGFTSYLVKGAEARGRGEGWRACGMEGRGGGGRGGTRSGFAGRGRGCRTWGPGSTGKGDTKSRFTGYMVKGRRWAGAQVGGCVEQVMKVFKAVMKVCGGRGDTRGRGPGISRQAVGDKEG